MRSTTPASRSTDFTELVGRADGERPEGHARRDPAGCGRRGGCRRPDPTAVTGLVEDRGRVVGVKTTSGELRAPLVVGADGARSTVARLVGAAEYHRTPPGGLFLWAYLEGVPADERRHVAGQDRRPRVPRQSPPTPACSWQPSSPRWIAGTSCAATGRPRTPRRWPTGRSSRPSLAGARAGRAGPDDVRGHGFFRESAGPGWVLVGDAGHFKDPTPGQGISDALRQAVELARRDREGTGRRRRRRPGAARLVVVAGPGRLGDVLVRSRHGCARPAARCWFRRSSVASRPTRSSPRGCCVSSTTTLLLRRCSPRRSPSPRRPRRS